MHRLWNRALDRTPVSATPVNPTSAKFAAGQVVYTIARAPWRTATRSPLERSTGAHAVVEITKETTLANKNVEVRHMETRRMTYPPPLHRCATPHSVNVIVPATVAAAPTASAAQKRLLAGSGVSTVPSVKASPAPMKPPMRGSSRR